MRRQRQIGENLKRERLWVVGGLICILWKSLQKNKEVKERKKRIKERKEKENGERKERGYKNRKKTERRQKKREKRKKRGEEKRGKESKRKELTYQRRRDSPFWRIHFRIDLRAKTGEASKAIVKAE